MTPSRAVQAPPRPAGPRPTRRHGARSTILVAVLAGCLLLAPAASLGFGSAAVPFAEAFEILGSKLFGIGDLSGYDSSVVAIIWLNRVPRILTAIAVGCILGISGVAMQAVIRNPLAEPYVLGISSGASSGAAASIILLGATGAVAVGGAAFLGAVAATALVLWLGSGRSGSTLRLVLAGVAIGFIFQAATNLIITSANDAETAQSVVFWSLGSLTRPP
ncbi:FecCD family ABC transporter permease [Corynebacterium sp. 335C]